MTGATFCCILMLAFSYVQGVDVCIFGVCGPLNISVTRRIPFAETKNGPVVGHIVNSSSSPIEYFAFEGIPYAKPPVGQLRFETPEPASNWSSILTATQTRSNCIQGDYTGSGGEEDCLHLNVYIPPRGLQNFPSNPPGLIILPQHLPVMVYIHGGAFQTGSGNFTYRNPDYFMDRNNVILVTLEYRLGVFGFASTGDTFLPGNNGLKDQVLGLKWVKNNIHFFGGDPNNVTIFGESAGSVSVSLHLLSRQSKGLFRNAIMESGTSLCPWAVNPVDVNRNGLKQVGQKLNIYCSTSQCLVSKLKEVAASEILKHAMEVQNLNAIFGNVLSNLIVFAPVIEPYSKGAFLITEPYEDLFNGKINNNVPILIGLNSQEALLPPSAILILNFYLIRYLINVKLLVPTDMNVPNQTIANLVGNKIRDFYFGELGSTFQTAKIDQFGSDVLFNRGVRKQAQLESKYNSVYFYKFDYVGNLSFPRPPNSDPGASHSEEIFYLWARTGKAPSESDNLTILRMTTLWTNFAQSGNPTPQRDVLFNNTLWPTINAESTPLVYLDINYNLTVLSNPYAKNMEFWDGLYQKYGRRPFTTY